MDKIYCSECKYCKGRDCYHIENTKDNYLDGTAYSRPRKLDWIYCSDVNRKNDCKLFEKRFLNLKEGDLFYLILIIVAVVVAGFIFIVK